MTPRTTADGPAVEIFIDGASLGNPGPAGVGAVFLDEQGARLARLSKYVGETTNNVAEYLALLYALQEAQARGWRHVSVKTDSELLAKQLSGEYKVRDQTLRLFHELARHLMRAFERCAVEHVSRSRNAEADRLAGEAVEDRFDTSVKRT
ncbi:MAG: ribonuclease HI family protein [Candidatus Omnitrophica bacterium]|nr:ribonuclease HI family protein [Candidatus Omnitrophota bacterium]